MDTQGRKAPFRSNPPDIINRPNPVEPHATPEKHPLHGSKQLSKPTKKDFLRLLLADDDGTSSSTRPAKRRKSGAPSSLDLPLLPVIGKQGTQRLRIPPTLSGLHQPPPDAGLLPSMSTEQPVDLVEKSETTKSAVSQSTPGPNNTSANAANAKSVRKHKRWSDKETSDLLKGVARFGIGKWTLVLNCADFHFDGRTALDLKDRFRVCCPEEYRQGRSVKSSRLESSPKGAGVSHAESQEQPRSKRSNRVSAAELEKLGIDGPFQKSNRRQRTEWNAREDEALLAGFRMHNNSWAVIRNTNHVLKTRTTTDLRDRLRARYPEEYAKAGLAPRANNSSQKGRRDSLGEIEKQDVPKEKENTTTSMSLAMTDIPPRREYGQPTQASVKRQLPPTSILHSSDVFWGAPFELENSESEPITLDRGILDWPIDQRKAAMNHDVNSKGASIDPLAALNLPRPTAASAGAATTVLPIQQNTLTTSSSTSLPSLATITAVGDADPFTEPPELPSLMGSFGQLETDGRSAGHFMSMEELLS